jgi:ABC-type hemin transport system ATPase subunit
MTGASTSSTPNSSDSERELVERRIVERELAALGEPRLDSAELRVLEGREEDAVAFARSLARLASVSGGLELDDLALARVRRRIESARGDRAHRPAAVMMALALASAVVLLPRATLDASREGSVAMTAAELDSLRQAVRGELDRVDVGPPGARTRELARRLQPQGGAPP